MQSISKLSQKYAIDSPCKDLTIVGNDKGLTWKLFAFIVNPRSKCLAAQFSGNIPGSETSMNVTAVTSVPYHACKPLNADVVKGTLTLVKQPISSLCRTNNAYDSSSIIKIIC